MARDGSRLVYVCWRKLAFLYIPAISSTSIVAYIMLALVSARIKYTSALTMASPTMYGILKAATLEAEAGIHKVM